MGERVLKFRDGSGSLTSIRTITEETWAELGENESLQAQARSLGFDPATLRLELASPFEIRPASAGFDPTGTAILIGLGAWATSIAADVTKAVLLDLWRQLILPRIKDRLGSDAVGDEEDR
jgi:hypothetical protein